MKMGYIAIAIIVIISLLLILFTYYLNDVVTDITSLMDNVNKHVKNKEYLTAYKAYKKVKDRWKKAENIIQIQVENDEIDYINEVFSELDSYFEKNFFEDFFEASYRLNFHINHLYEKNIVKMENIL